MLLIAKIHTLFRVISPRIPHLSDRLSIPDFTTRRPSVTKQLLEILKILESDTGPTSIRDFVTPAERLHKLI